VLGILRNRTDATAQCSVICRRSVLEPACQSCLPHAALQITVLHMEFRQVVGCAAIVHSMYPYMIRPDEARLSLNLIKGRASYVLKLLLTRDTRRPGRAWRGRGRGVTYSPVRQRLQYMGQSLCSTSMDAEVRSHTPQSRDAQRPDGWCRECHSMQALVLTT
jgi:hypothetical protein